MKKNDEEKLARSGLELHNIVHNMATGYCQQKGIDATMLLGMAIHSLALSMNKLALILWDNDNERALNTISRAVNLTNRCALDLSKPKRKTRKKKTCH